MPNTVIVPTFQNEGDRLLFLSRLYSTPTSPVTLTPQDVSAWDAYKLLEPTGKLPTETESEYSERLRLWHEGRVLNFKHYILSKFAGYGLGKVRPAVELYLADKPNPNPAQSRAAVGLQLQEKWAFWIANKDVPTELLLLVKGIAW